MSRNKKVVVTTVDDSDTEEDDYVYYNGRPVQVKTHSHTPLSLPNHRRSSSKSSHKSKSHMHQTAKKPSQRQSRDRPRHEKPKRQYPKGAFLPIGVDCTDDVVHIDSDSENEVNIAETHVQDLLRQRREQPKQQGVFMHAMAIKVAAQKRKRYREEVAARRKRQAATPREEKRTQLWSQEQQQQRQKQLRKERKESRKRYQDHAARKNPTGNVNFVIIDSDPDEDLTMSRPSPQKTVLPQKTSTFHTRETESRHRPPPSLPRQGDSVSVSPAEALAAKIPAATRRRAPQPYQGCGAGRKESAPTRAVKWRGTANSSFDNSRFFSYGQTHEEAAEEQERLLREAAERVRQRQAYGQHQSQQEAGGGVAENPLRQWYGPTFHSVIRNIHVQFPNHFTWKSPYSCLGLPPNAGVDAAKQQYRTLIRCYHPDKSKRDTSQKFNAVVQAFNKIRRQGEGA